MVIYILIDDKGSWFVPYGRKLKSSLDNEHTVYVIHDSKVECVGDICFMLSCTKLVNQKFMQQFENCIVVHASDLPKGKGFSPLQHQILDGKNSITLTLFEAVTEVDAGPFYFKDNIIFEGHELLGELREKMADKIIEMCQYYIEHRNELKPTPQPSIPETFYRKLAHEDDRLNINDTILNQINHFRIADNEKHPLWFEYMDHEYTVEIRKR